MRAAAVKANVYMSGLGGINVEAHMNVVYADLLGTNTTDNKTVCKYLLRYQTFITCTLALFRPLFRKVSTRLREKHPLHRIDTLLHM